MPLRHSQCTRNTACFPRSKISGDGWDAKRLLDWVQKIGPNTHATVESMLGQRKHPHQSYRAGLVVLRMGRDYSDPRLEAACIHCERRVTMQEINTIPPLRFPILNESKRFHAFN